MKTTTKKVYHQKHWFERIGTTVEGKPKVTCRWCDMDRDEFLTNRSPCSGKLPYVIPSEDRVPDPAARRARDRDRKRLADLRDQQYVEGEFQKNTCLLVFMK
jgi:hypothetical protein